MLTNKVLKNITIEALHIKLCSLSRKVAFLNAIVRGGLTWNFLNILKTLWKSFAAMRLKMDQVRLLNS